MKPDSESKLENTNNGNIPLIISTQLEHLCHLDISQQPTLHRKTSIICTIGPSCDTVEKLQKMIANGMNIARLNFSHGSHQFHEQIIANIREALRRNGDEMIDVAIALDTKGPEIRTGIIEMFASYVAKFTCSCKESNRTYLLSIDHLEKEKYKGKNKHGEKNEVLLQSGNDVIVTTNDAFVSKCSSEMIYFDYKNIINVIKKGSVIYIDDGLLMLVVKKIEGESIFCKIENGGLLGSRKGVNLPGALVDFPAVTERDCKDLQFATKMGIDIIFASFTRNADGIREIRKILGEKGKQIKVIAKIENQQGVDNADEIIREADGIMIARGDLGIEIPAEKVFLVQKMLTAKCNIAGKPVICATQMLESMISRPRPTRAEGGDVANAVLDGTDCVMLSGETAKGKYPIEAILTMHQLCKEAETAIFYMRTSEELMRLTPKPTDDAQTVAIAANSAVQSCQAVAVICVTVSGRAATLVSRYRPPVPIYAVCNNRTITRQLHLWRGIYPIYLKAVNTDWREDLYDRIRYAIKCGKEQEIIRDGDPLVIVSGAAHGYGATYGLRIVKA
uniref:Pyruvate kinase n=1 Tax=Elaeophora elaphi TaxID=1147741 RepID=A0A158Q8G6_9BILA